MENTMCETKTQRDIHCGHSAARCGCQSSGSHHGFLSKKMKIQSLEKQLDTMKSHTQDLEEYIRELKEQ